MIFIRGDEMAAIRPEKIFFANITENRIAYHREGAGEVMLLVHGITTYSFIWRRMIPELSGQFDTVAVDLLGCGDSDKPSGADLSISSQAEMLLAFLDSLGIEKCHLVTHDVGGGIGQVLAVRFPERFHDLVLINSVGYDYWPVQPIVTLRVPFLRQVAFSMLDLGFLELIVRRGLYHKERATKELMDHFSRPLRTPEGRQGFLALARSLNNRHLMEIAEELSKLSMPVLIIRGDADPYLSPRIVERLHEEIGHSRLMRIATGGHFIQEDEPDLLCTLIHEFIEETAHVRSLRWAD